MAIYHFEKFQRLVSVINKEDIYTTICKNIKKFRLQRYNEFKNQNSQNTINNINTTTSNGKMISHIIKQRHIPYQAPLSYKHVEKSLIPDKSTKDIVIRIFDEPIEK